MRPDIYEQPRFELDLNRYNSTIRVYAQGVTVLNNLTGETLNISKIEERGGTKYFTLNNEEIIEFGMYDRIANILEII